MNQLTAASVRVLLPGDVPDAHLEVAVVVRLDEGVDGTHDALLVAVVVVGASFITRQFWQRHLIV